MKINVGHLRNNNDQVIERLMEVHCFHMKFKERIFTMELNK
jgi:hypothetical protein